MINLYSVQMVRENDECVGEWDEILLDRLIYQKNRLAHLALNLESEALVRWVGDWSFDVLELPDFSGIPERIQKDFPEGNVPKIVSEFFSYGILQFSIAAKNFDSGKFERALKSAFAIDHAIGMWEGMFRASAERGKGQRSSEDLEDKKLVLNYYSENGLYKLSNDAAATELTIVKPPLTKTKARTISLLIGKYKNFLSKCDTMEYGILILEKHKEAVAVLNSPGVATEAEMQRAQKFIFGKKENDRQRIDIFVELNEGGFMHVDYFDKKFFLSFYPLP